jgi:hypothetical protein
VSQDAVAPTVHHDRVSEQRTEGSLVSDLDDDTRRVAVTVVAAAAIGWWPAFTLGVYRVIFFEQQFALWAAATTVFLIASLTLRRRAWRRPALWSLLLPSLWLLIAWVLPVGGTSPAHRALFWLGVTVTVLGMPAMGGLMVRLLLPGAERLRGRPALAASSVVLLVMAGAFLLGTQHQRILTCEDFSISGNFAPEECSPGTGSTVLGG